MIWELYKAKKLGYSDDLYYAVLGKKLGGYKWLSDYEQTPYLYRAMPNMGHYYNREIDEIVGGSVGWNQLYNKTGNSDSNGITFTNSNGRITISGVATATAYYIYSISIPANHVIYFSGCPSGGSASTFDLTLTTSAGNVALYDNSGKIAKKNGNTTGINIDVRSGYDADENPVTFVPQLTDLTLALGTTIADYIYSLEQSTAGSGIAKLKSWGFFDKDYYAYDSGSIQSVCGLVSHDTVGKNLLSLIIDGTVPSISNGQLVSAAGARSIYIPATASTAYTLKIAPSSLTIYMFYYDKDKGFLSYSNGSGTLTATTPANTAYIMVRVSAVPSLSDITLAQLELGSTATAYEPYTHNSYALDSTITLRGVPKISNGQLYYDGDEYLSDGTVNRKYGVVDLGTLTWTSSWGGFSTNGLRGIAKVPTEAIVANLVCAKYPTVSYTNRADKTIYGADPTGQGNADFIAIQDSSYSSASDFKTAMSGVYLVYELQTPTTETADPFTKVQVCDSNGTEAYVATGVNVWDEVWEVGGLVYNTSSDDFGNNSPSPNQIRSKNYTPVKPNATYYFKAGEGIKAFMIGYDSNKKGIKTAFSSATGLGSSGRAWTIPSDCHYVRFYCIAEYGTTYNHDISINYPSTDHDYHQYGSIVPVGHNTQYAEK